MIAILVGELSLKSVCNLGLGLRAQEDVRYVKASDNGERLINAVVLAAGREQDFGEQWVRREFTHDAANLGQITLIV